MLFDIRLRLAARTREHLHAVAAALVGTHDVSSLRPHTRRAFELVPPSSAAIFRVLQAAGTRRVCLDVHPHELTLGVDAQGAPPLSLPAFAQLCNEHAVGHASLTYSCPLFNASGTWHRPQVGPWCIESSRIDDHLPATTIPAVYFIL